MKVNKLRQRFSHPAATGNDFETVDCDVCGNESDKNTGGSNRALITVLRKKERGGGKQTRVITANRVIAL